MVPPDDARLRVVQGDAADIIARLHEEADVILVDGFDARRPAAAPGHAAFYAGCRRALRPGGVLVANVFTYDPRYGAVLAALDAAFGGAHLLARQGGRQQPHRVRPGRRRQRRGPRGAPAAPAGPTPRPWPGLAEPATGAAATCLDHMAICTGPATPGFPIAPELTIRLRKPRLV
jgi:SAM-dependent methyltransferase